MTIPRRLTLSSVRCVQIYEAIQETGEVDFLRPKRSVTLAQVRFPPPAPRAPLLDSTPCALSQPCFHCLSLPAHCPLTTFHCPLTAFGPLGLYAGDRLRRRRIPVLPAAAAAGAPQPPRSPPALTSGRRIRTLELRADANGAAALLPGPPVRSAVRRGGAAAPLAAHGL